MRTRARIVTAVAALALTGCGNHNLVLKVDILSYLDDSQKVFSAASVPAIGEIGAIPIVGDQTIRLIEGLDGEAQVKSATLSLAGRVTAASGTGSGRFRLYLSDENTPPLETVPVIDVPVRFSADAPAIVAATGPDSGAGADEQQRVARLFTRKELHLAMVLDSVVIVAPGVTGLTVNLGKLEAIVIAGRKAF
jgi:hypothetical protein